ncbi:MAG: hypothetical protein RLZ37_564 [Actinomycetota bacterium]|jgi:hypothetical protein
MPPQTERTFQERSFGTEMGVVSRKSSRHLVSRVDSSTVGWCVESNRRAARTTTSIEQRSAALLIVSFSSPTIRRLVGVDSIANGRHPPGRIFS